MFVEPAYRASSEYTQFLTMLKRGEYQAAHCKRQRVRFYAMRDRVLGTLATAGSATLTRAA